VTSCQPKGIGAENAATRTTLTRRTMPIVFPAQAAARDWRLNGAKPIAAMPDRISQFDPVHVIVSGITPWWTQEWRTHSSGRRNPWKASRQGIGMATASHFPNGDKPRIRLPVIAAPPSAMSRLGPPSSHPLATNPPAATSQRRRPRPTNSVRCNGSRPWGWALIHIPRRNAATTNVQTSRKTSNEGYEAW
jgi:hypothetical protein